VELVEVEVKSLAHFEPIARSQFSIGSL